MRYDIGMPIPGVHLRCIPLGEALQLWHVLGEIPGIIECRLVSEEDGLLAPAIHLADIELHGVRRIVDVPDTSGRLSGVDLPGLGSSACGLPSGCNRA